MVHMSQVGNLAKVSRAFVTLSREQNKWRET